MLGIWNPEGEGSSFSCQRTHSPVEETSKLQVLTHDAPLACPRPVRHSEGLSSECGFMIAVKIEVCSDDGKGTSPTLISFS